MDVFFEKVRSQIPPSSMEKWEFDVDVSYSCFRFEHAKIFSLTLSGHGGINMREIGIDILVRLSVENSYRMQVLFQRVYGLETALKTVYDIPDTAGVCMECANVILDKTKGCDNCLFFKAYTEYKKISETCSICQTPTYRTTLDCGHFFHKTCLLSIDPVDPKCPNCRHPISKTWFMEMDEDEDDSESMEEDDDEE